jgi:hypothetical protein
MVDVERVARSPLVWGLWADPPLALRVQVVHTAGQRVFEQESFERKRQTTDATPPAA